MTLEQVKGLNVAQVIRFYGTDSRVRERTFLMYYDEEGVLREVSFEAFLHISLEYGRLIHAIREEKGKLNAGRFHVGFFMQNTPESVFLLGGCAFTNSTLVGINNAQVGKQLAADVKNTDVEALFVDEAQQPKTDRTFLETLMEAHRQWDLGDLYPDYVIARRRQPAGHPSEIATIEEMLTRHREHPFSPVPLDENSPGVIIFTSGTTGAPKGIEVLWKKVFDVGAVSTALLRFSEDDVGYVCMPLNHSNSLYLTLMPALLNGAKVLLRRRFSASHFVEDISRSRATVWNCVGDPVRYVLSRVDPRADYSHLPLRIVVSTGTNAANRDAFTRIFGLDIFAEAYGSTEVGALAMVTPETPRYSVGRALPGKDVRILDETTGLECRPAILDPEGNILNFTEAVGEIVVSQESLGASAFSGYYHLPAESAERVDRKGFYHMGDLGAIEERNGARYIIFLGRTGTDRLRNKGENFSAASVEEVIRRHPDVVDCAVIGIPYVDSTENDNPVYVIEATAPAGFDLQGFYDYCVRSVPPHALPGYIRLVSELPRTDTHKIRKSALAKEFIERTPARDADENDTMYMVKGDGIHEFRTSDFHAEMARCVDPVIRARFVAATRRQDIF
jgi:fatty-acyl-CoA synthase